MKKIISIIIMVIFLMMISMNNHIIYGMGLKNPLDELNKITGPVPSYNNIQQGFNNVGGTPTEEEKKKLEEYKNNIANEKANANAISQAEEALEKKYGNKSLSFGEDLTAEQIIYLAGVKLKGVTFPGPYSTQAFENAYNKLEKFSNEISDATKNDPTSVAAKLTIKDNFGNHLGVIPLDLLKSSMTNLLIWKGMKAEDANNQAQETVDNMMKAIIANLPGEDRGNVVFNDVLANIGTYKPGNLDPTSSNKIETVTSKILTIITNIGIAVSVIMLATLGIKYMLGSVEEKAEYKQSLIPYVVGAFILFGITSFIKILMSFGNLIAGI